jgi:hypothetical protein
VLFIGSLTLGDTSMVVPIHSDLPLEKVLKSYRALKSGRIRELCQLLDGIRRK